MHHHRCFSLYPKNSMPTYHVGQFLMKYSLAHFFFDFQMFLLVYSTLSLSHVNLRPGQLLRTSKLIYPSYDNPILSNALGIITSWKVLFTPVNSQEILSPVKSSSEARVSPSLTARAKYILKSSSSRDGSLPVQCTSSFDRALEFTSLLQPDFSRVTLSKNEKSPEVNAVIRKLSTSLI